MGAGNEVLGQHVHLEIFLAETTPTDTPKHLFWPFSRPPVQPNGSFVGLQQKANFWQVSEVNRWEAIHQPRVFDGWNINQD
jgi:hypothetical protein